MAYLFQTEDLFRSIMAYERFPELMTQLGVDLALLSEDMEKSLQGTSLGQEDCVGFSREAKSIVEAAFREARSANHNYIGPEHILLGFLTEEGKVRDLLGRHGVTYARVRSLIFPPGEGKARSDDP